MAEQEQTRLERISEWAYRTDTAQNLWQVTKPWMVPVVSGLVAALLRYREHVAPSQVFLMALVAFYVPFIGAYAVKSYKTISDGRRRFDTLSDQMLAACQAVLAARPPTIAPTQGMVEASIRERAQKIETWRAMITDVHAIIQQERRNLSSGDVQSATALLEADPRFNSLRRWLTDQSKEALWPTRRIIVPADDGSTMDLALRRVIDDIDAQATEWGLD